MAWKAVCKTNHLHLNGRIIAVSRIDVYYKYMYNEPVNDLSLTVCAIW